MIAAGLLAKKAVERGLAAKPWVKTSVAPGSRVVMDYYERAGLLPYLEALGYDLVGFGCTTCIGNSGPIDPALSAVADRLAALVSVLSGNRNFEGRINPDVRMNYLASPPLVIAYALAGTMDIDTSPRSPSAPTATGIRCSWPTADEVQRTIRESLRSEMFTAVYESVSEDDDRWNGLDVASGQRFGWDDTSTYHDDPRRRRALRRRRRALDRPRRHRVRVRIVSRLGDQRHDAARRPGRAGRELRTHPPIQPHRHGRTARAVHHRRQR